MRKALNVQCGVVLRCAGRIVGVGCLDVGSVERVHETRYSRRARARWMGATVFGCKHENCTLNCTRVFVDRAFAHPGFEGCQRACRMCGRGGCLW